MENDRQHSKPQQKPIDTSDPVDVASYDSFPASDPPSHSGPRAMRQNSPQPRPAPRSREPRADKGADRR